VTIGRKHSGKIATETARRWLRLSVELDSALADFVEDDAAVADAAAMLESNHEIETVAIAIAATSARTVADIQRKAVALTMDGR
jgi:hypothetical protein